MKKGGIEMMKHSKEIRHVLLRMRPPDFYRLHASAQAAGQSLNLHVNQIIKNAISTNPSESQKAVGTCGV